MAQKHLKRGAVPTAPKSPKRKILRDFWDDETVGALSPSARMFLSALLMAADAHGEVPDKPLDLKRDLCPHIDFNPADIIGELLQAHALVRQPMGLRGVLRIARFHVFTNVPPVPPSSPTPKR